MPNICVIGDREDLTCAYLMWIARRKGFRLFELGENGLGVDWNFSFDDQAAGSGTLEIGGDVIAFTEIGGAYVRMSPQPSLPARLKLDPVQSQAFIHERRLAMHQFIESLPCPVANRPSAGRANASKPHQMAALEQFGFRIPRWVVTSDRETASRFLDAVNHEAIYKACSGLRSRVRRANQELLDRLTAGTSPTLIQHYISGSDVRIHTIGDRAFATNPNSSSVDYRFEDTPAQYSACAAPAALVAQCCKFAKKEGLVIAGFDFRVAADGCWYCLEANPVPSFMPYELATGQPIAEALLNELVATEANATNLLQSQQSRD